MINDFDLTDFIYLYKNDIKGLDFAIESFGKQKLLNLLERQSSLLKEERRHIREDAGDISDLNTKISCVEALIKYLSKDVYTVNHQHYTLNESSLNRIIHHLKTSEFMIISPYRDSRTEEQNYNLYKELKKSVRAKGFGFIELLGGYLEFVKDPKTGEIMKDEETGEPVTKMVTELSLLIPNNDVLPLEEFKNFAFDLRDLYNQDSVLLNLPSEGASYYYNDGYVEYLGKSLSLTSDVIKNYFSALRNNGTKNARRKWVITDKPNGNLEKLTEDISFDGSFFGVRVPCGSPDTFLFYRDGNLSMKYMI